MDAMYVETFNSQYIRYVNNETIGVNVINLIDKVSENNENYNDSKVSLKFKPLIGETITNFSDETLIKRNKYYKTEISEYNSDGLIQEITITELAG